MAQAVQALTADDRSNTILSVDGVGAFDFVSRGAMMSGFLRMGGGGGAVLPFVRQFYGRPSIYFWDNENGQVHEIVQGEGGKQGDPLMLALFALGEHAVFVVVQDTLFPSEKLFAFLDDIYAVQNLRRSLKSTLLWGVNCGFMHASTSIKEDAVLEPGRSRVT